MHTTRRQFIGSAAGAMGVAALGKPMALFAQDPRTDRFASNAYPWHTFYAREGRDWYADLDASLREFAKSGVKGYEPSINSPSEIEALLPLLEKHGLWMTSIYVNSLLHEHDRAAKSIDDVLAIAEAASRAGVKIIVTNPAPIGWGSPEDKTESQVEYQARNLEHLGAELSRLGLVLAYHNHDAEMRRSAREFHHMMLATDPAHVKLCLDAHWVFRGSGDSQVVLFDIVKLYGPRIVELHLRQSKNGVWTETLGSGDIDYPRLVRELDVLGVHPHLVLEQAVEEETPKTMDAVEAHTKSLAYAANVFDPLIP